MDPSNVGKTKPAFSVARGAALASFLTSRISNFEV